MNNETNSPASEPFDKADATAGKDVNIHAQAMGQKPKRQKMGLVGVIISIFIIGAMAHFAGWDENSLPLAGEAHVGITKAQWRQKALPFYNPGGGIKLTTVGNFKAAMGEPSNTQTVEGHAFWYYDCVDGMIQVVMVDPSLSGGRLAIDSINDY